jgi:hypothetical protein
MNYVVSPGGYNYELVIAHANSNQRILEMEKADKALYDEYIVFNLSSLL